MGSVSAGAAKYVLNIITGWDQYIPYIPDGRKLYLWGQDKGPGEGQDVEKE